MEKILIVAEKGSQANIYAQALFGNNNKSGVFEGKSIKIVSLYGHVITYKEPKDIVANLTWNYDILPLEIENIPKKVINTKKVIFNKVVNEMNSDYTYILNATDCDREGSYLFWEIYYSSKSKIPVKRYYPKELIVEVLKEELTKKFEDIEYDKRMFLSGETRSFIDYQFGNNNTMLFSLKAGELTKVGRVKLAIISIVKKREDDIEKFGKGREYFVLEIKFEKGDSFYYGILETKEKIYDIGIAESLQQDIQENLSIGKIIQFNHDMKKENPNKLFSLLPLSRKCSKLFGWGAKHTLSIAQSLYDRGINGGYMSYPRTKIEYLPESYRTYITSYYNGFKSELSLSYEIQDPGKRVYDNSKVKEHEGIRPIFKTGFLNNLKGDELLLYKLLIVQLFKVFGEEEIYENYSIKTQVGNHVFKTNIKNTLNEGWKKIEKELMEKLELTKIKKKKVDTSDDEDETENGDDYKSSRYKNIENFNLDSIVNISDFFIKTQKENPPVKLNEDLLLGACEKPKSFLLESEKDNSMIQYMPEAGIGTVGTLGTIIDEMLENQLLIKDSKGKYSVGEKGLNLWSILPEKYKGLLMTAELEFILDQIAEGKKEAKTEQRKFLDELHNDIIENIELIPQLQSKTDGIGEKIDIPCPKCTNDLIKVISKKNKKLYAICSKSKIAGKGDCDFIQEYDEKKNKLAEGYSGQETKYACPNCKNNLQENAKTLFCTCGFTLWKTMYQITLNKTQIGNILKNGRLNKLDLVSQAGKNYQANVVLDNVTGKTSLEFIN